MRVAIMGAGLSGLSCAITLEQNGVNPTIFESRSEVGDRFVNAEALLPILDRPVRDPLALLSDRFGIYLQPISNVREMILYSPQQRAVLHGNLGFINSRGRVENSYEKQLAKQVKSEIIFNSLFTYEQLLQDFTHIVIATGDAAYATKLANFQQDLTVKLKGATVEGKFTRSTVTVWLDNRFAPQGYGFLLPFSDQEACITIAYAEYPENRKLSVDDMWHRFYNRVCDTVKQNLVITDRFEISKYIIGKCRYPRIGNTFFTGNCMCGLTPGFGFGQLSSLLSGIYAGKELSGTGSYLELSKNLYRGYDNSLVIRRSFELLSNKQFDTLVKVMNSSIARKLIKLQRINPLRLASYVLRPVTLINKRQV